MDFQSLECIFYDFDGVMTDNRCLVDQNGVEAVFVNRSDGYAISKIHELGIPQIIISTEKNPVVEKRAEKLGIPVIYGVTDKGNTIQAYCSEKGIQASKTLFIGNDLNDLSAFHIVGMRGAPADAEEEILSIADWISDQNGGDGVIRDLYRQIMISLQLDGGETCTKTK